MHSIHANYNYCVNFLPNEVSVLIIDKPTANAFALIMLDIHTIKFYLTHDTSCQTTTMEIVKVGIWIYNGEKQKFIAAINLIYNGLLYLSKWNELIYCTDPFSNF